MAPELKKPLITAILLLSMCYSYLDFRDAPGRLNEGRLSRHLTGRACTSYLVGHNIDGFPASGFHIICEPQS
jgi:hypothetical protein